MAAQGLVKLGAGMAIFAAGMVAGSFFFPREGAPTGQAAVASAEAGKSGAGSDGVEVPDARGRTRGAGEASGEATPSAAGEAAAEAASKALSEALEEKEGLEAKVKALGERLAAAEKREADLEEEIRRIAADQAAPRGPAIDFGTWGEVEAIRDADWPTLGAAAKDIGDLVGQLMELGFKNPKAMPLQIEIAKHNQKLQSLALAANGKLPTHATGNGEYTHPIVLANLLREHLVLLGLPLDEGQVAEIARAGERYDLEWSAAQQGYGEETFLVQKLIDELAMKKAFCDRMEAVLTPEQRAVVANPRIRHLFLLDLHSPLLLFAGRASADAKPTVDALRADMVQGLAQLSGVAADDLAALPIGDAWLAAQQERLVPVPADQAIFFHIDDALAAGRAQIAAMQAILGLVPDEEARARVIAYGTLHVPRLVVQGE